MRAFWAVMALCLILEAVTAIHHERDHDGDDDWSSESREGRRGRCRGRRCPRGRRGRGKGKGRKGCQRWKGADVGVTPGGRFLRIRRAKYGEIQRQLPNPGRWDDRAAEEACGLGHRRGRIRPKGRPHPRPPPSPDRETWPAPVESVPFPSPPPGAPMPREGTDTAAGVFSVSSGLGGIKPTDSDFRNRLIFDQESEQETAMTGCSSKCKSPPGSSICIEYDPEFQAVTMEEAMVKFKDLSLPSDVIETNETSTGVDCDDDDVACQECMEEFLEWISNSQSVGFDDFQDTFNARNRYRKLQGSAQESHNRCKRFGFSFRTKSIANGTTGSGGGRGRTRGESGSCLKDLESLGRDNWQRRWGRPQRHPSQPPPPPLTRRERRLCLNAFTQGRRPPPYCHRLRRGRGRFGEYRQDQNRRQKRAAVGSLDDAQITIIDCVRKGEYRELGETKSTEAISAEASIPAQFRDGAVGLCNICWVWRKLPDNYFPSIINEIRCLSQPPAGVALNASQSEPSEEDARCLSGHGMCVPRRRRVPVLVWPTKPDGSVDESKTWTRASVDISTCCDCHILRGSQLARLITDE